MCVFSGEILSNFKPENMILTNTLDFSRNSDPKWLDFNDKVL
jgi:hypothetical protein